MWITDKEAPILQVRSDHTIEVWRDKPFTDNSVNASPWSGVEHISHVWWDDNAKIAVLDCTPRWSMGCPNVYSIASSVERSCRNPYWFSALWPVRSKCWFSLLSRSLSRSLAKEFTMHHASGPVALPVRTRKLASRRSSGVNKGADDWPRSSLSWGSSNQSITGRSGKSWLASRSSFPRAWMTGGRRSSYLATTL